jgi:hypothetical protein
MLGFGLVICGAAIVCESITFHGFARRAHRGIGVPA